MQSYAWLPDRRYETGIFFYKKYGVMMGGMPYFDVTTGLDGQGNPKATEAGGNGKDGKRQVSSVA